MRFTWGVLDVGYRVGESPRRMEMSYGAKLAGSFCGTHGERAVDFEEGREEFLMLENLHCSLQSKKGQDGSS